MNGGSDNQVLSLLCAIRGDLGHIKGDIAEIRERMGRVADAFECLSQRMDRLGGNVARIRSRLD